MRIRMLLPLSLSLLLTCTTLPAAEETTTAVHERLGMAFTQGDIDGDQRLSLAEFLAGRDNVAMAKRDFRMCDFNDDQHLSLEEFLTVPSVVEAKHRGPMPDLITDHADQIMQTLDKTYHWDTEPNGVFNPNFMVVALAQQLSEWGGGSVSDDAHDVIDPDKKGLTRDKALRFIEICLGLRHSDGTLLRLSNGRVIDSLRFHQADFDSDNQLDEREFSRLRNRPLTAFAALDTDGNGTLSLAEWISIDGGALIDPVEDFRRMDTNLDAAIDREELIRGAAAEHKAIAGFLLPAFDWDQNGTLSLREYRSTMHANPILPWHDAQVDADEDGCLNFKEFGFEPFPSRWPLLRMFYFQRLDRNQDKKLDASEWNFRKPVPAQFYSLNADGTDWRPVYRFEAYRSCYAPSVSPDGQSIAFVARKGTEPVSLFIMPIEGGSPKLVVEESYSASWSPDGERILYTRPAASASAVWEVVISKGEKKGTPRQLMQGAIAARWSPDGKSIGTTNFQTVSVYEPATDLIREIYSGADEPYPFVFGAPVWSPDGRKFCAMGRTSKQKSHLICFDVTKPEPTVSTLQKLPMAYHDLTWHPTQPRLVFTTYCSERQRSQLYEFDPASTALPTLFPGQDPTLNNTSVCWTPDGKRLIVISGDY